MNYTYFLVHTMTGIQPMSAGYYTFNANDGELKRAILPCGTAPAAPVRERHSHLGHQRVQQQHNLKTPAAEASSVITP